MTSYAKLSQLPATQPIKTLSGTAPMDNIIIGLNNPQQAYFTTVNDLTLTSESIGFQIAGGITSKTLNVSNTGTISGNNTGDQIITLTGDVTGTGTGTFATTLATVNSNVGTFGSATKSTTVVANGHGLITAISETTVTPAVGSITGLGTDVAAALAINIGTAGSPIVNGGTLGTPSGGVATNLTGTASGLTAGTVTTNANLTGAVTSSGNATSLGSFTSANLASALSDETGSGAAVFATSPTLITPLLGTPTSGVLTNCTGTAMGLTSGITKALISATTTVDVSAATAPTTGQILTATSSTTATWQSGSGVSLATVFATFYPIGSYYFNETDSTNPATLFGFGTWVAVTDKFIVGHGSTYTSTGGAATVTLSQANMPSYNLTVTAYANLNAGSNLRLADNTGSTGTASISSGGSNASFSIIPPYQAVYIWKRTA